MTVFHGIVHFIHICVKDFSHLDSCAKIATIFGSFSIPIALLAIWKDYRKHRHEREMETYRELSKEYRDFLKLCLEHPEFRWCDYGPGPLPPTGRTERDKQYLVYEVLVSLFESAFFYYERHSAPFKKRQWNGWEELIKSWCDRQDFQYAWYEYLNSQWDQSFLDYMGPRVRAAKLTRLLEGHRIIRTTIKNGEGSIDFEDGLTMTLKAHEVDHGSDVSGKTADRKSVGKVRQEATTLVLYLEGGLILAIPWATTDKIKIGDTVGKVRQEGKNLRLDQEDHSTLMVSIVEVANSVMAHNAVKKVYQEGMALAVALADGSKLTIPLAKATRMVVQATDGSKEDAV